ncbi:SLP adapter and CSK-interacting membrane protein [Fukomys damarensis]|uniref:SLP adapter and CSK-interacting membrane protein n=1 Tax=Fukomys damarensis TaxID=885580 RepID=UPI00054035F6|nr:SLP adapter and CSK-interacting membrane protein [Fukomys damarensis]
MSWFRNYFWIILAAAIIVVSLVLGFLLCCVYRWKFKQGKKWKIAKPLKQNQREEEKMYENVQSPSPLPPLPPRGSFSQGNSPPQEIPATYSLVNKATNKKTVSTLNYIEPENDYDDVEIPGNTQNLNSKVALYQSTKTKLSSGLQERCHIAIGELEDYRKAGSPQEKSGEHIIDAQ